MTDLALAIAFALSDKPDARSIGWSPGRVQVAAAPSAPTATPAATEPPTAWQMVDADGQVWQSMDRQSLITHVAARNAAIQAPRPTYQAPARPACYVDSRGRKVCPR